MHPQFEELNPKWFNRANVYTGSIGDFRYRFATDKKESVLLRGSQLREGAGLPLG